MATPELDRSLDPRWFFAGPGVSNTLAREVAWEHTGLGPCSGWSTSLKTTLAMVFHARQPMFVWWGPGLIQFYNDAYLPSFGRGKHPAAMGQRGRDCWQEIWPIIGPQIDDVMARGQASWNEDALVPIERNGRLEEVYWTYSYCPVFDDDGSIGGTLVVCTETTARVVAERRMRLLRALGDRSALTTDLPTLLRRAAQVIAEFSADIPLAVLLAEDRPTGGLRLAGLVGPEPAAVTPAVHAALLAALADDAPDPASRAALGLPATRGPWPEPVEQVWVAALAGPGPRPSAVLALGVSPRLGFDDTYRRFFAQIHEHLDVARTRIEADQARLATQRERDNLLLHAPVATALLTGPEHRFALVNPMFCQMLGRRDLPGRTYLEAFPELAHTPLPGIFDRVLSAGEPFVAHEYRLPLDLDRDGHSEDRYFKFNLEPVRDDAGAVYGMMAVALDITDQVLARRTLERTSDEREKLLAALAAANRTKDEFLAMLGHELRNPLAPIVTALQIMKLRSHGEPSREHHVIERQVTHLVRLVDDLLDVARITRGQIELRRETVDIADVLAKGIEMASHLLEKRGHRLTLELPDSPLRCDGDPVRLAQVVANLLTNAARYTEPGGHVRVSARRCGDHVELHVQDDGMGIPADVLPRMFDLFVQGKRSEARLDGGLGIGLALVKNLVTLHGGTVTARSDGPGHGSEFIVSLPSAVPDPPAAPASAARPAPAGARVLVVDDNVDAAEVLADMLTHHGHAVAVAHDALAALELLPRFRPDAAILDIGLPVIDGHELAARIRSDPATAACRLIALSGYGQPSPAQHSDFERHLIKPVDIDALLELLQTPPP